MSSAATAVQENGISEGRYIRDNSDYSHFQKRLESHMSEEKQGRFVPMSQRRKESVSTSKNYQEISRGKYQTSWRGVSCLKGPLDMIIYQQLLWHEKPATIIELGSFSGASAMWLADIAKINQQQCHVYSIDIDISMVSPVARQHRDCTFIQGDATKIAESFPAEMLESLPHPWVMIEDCHVDLIGCMEHFHQFMQPGDYFIIEDTCPLMPRDSGQSLFEEDGYDEWGMQKHTLMEKFVADHENLYAVDTHYTDFFGYNAHFNWNGFLRRMK